MSKRAIRTLVLLAAACATLLAMAATGSARGSGGDGDGNHDRIPDRWERAHHLSLKVNQANRDQDHDGLRNRAEFVAGTNPRNHDSDHDGTDDGDEGAGTVTSFTAGVLVVHLFNGDDVEGKVDDRTKVKCKTRPSSLTARSASEGPGGDGHGDRDDDRGDDDQGDDDQGHHHGANCDASALTAGAIVRKARLKATAAGLVFGKIEIVKAAS